VEVLCAALRVDGKPHARVPAVFRGEVAGLQLELADGIHAQLCVLAVVRANVRINRAVQINVVVASP
jgi:hypothetical protein